MPRCGGSRARAAVRTSGRYGHDQEGHGAGNRAGSVLARRRRPAPGGQLPHYRERQREAVLRSGRFPAGRPRCPQWRKSLSTARQQPGSALDPKVVEKILAEVKEDEIVAMACDVINIPSPTGEELAMAEYMQRA